MSEKQFVYGILYKDSKEAEKARKEWKGIEYLIAQNDMEDMQTVLTLYNKLVQRKVLKTAVGEKYLYELKHKLLEAEEIENNRICDFNAEDVKWLEEQAREKRIEIRKQKEEKKKQDQREKKENNYYKHKYYNSLVINILLVGVILAIMYITLNSSNVNILNYENALIDKYSSWETSLQQREQEVSARERELQKQSSQN